MIPSLSSLISNSPVVISLIIVILVFFAKFLNNKPSNNQLRLPPGPTPLPFIGCIIQMLLNRPTFRWIHKLMDQFKTPIICIKLGPSTHVIVVSCPNLACEFLRKQDVIFSSRPEILSTYLASDGYQTASMSLPGDQWKKMRAKVQHILSPPIHKWLKPKRDQEANQLLIYICNQIQKQEGGLVNIRITSQHFFGNMIRNLIFGRRFFGNGIEDGGPGDEETEHVSSVLTILHYIYAFSITDFFPLLLRCKTDFDGHEKIIRDAIQRVRKYQDGLIDERIQMWDDGIRMVNDDMLDLLINHEIPKLTSDEIKAQILELTLASIDNSSNAIEWVMGEMMNEPTILKKAVEELDHEVGRNRLVEEGDLPRLNYIKACIKEAFRLHPFAPFNFPHVSTMNTTVAGYFIPKGSHILLSRLGLGRNPNVWTDPLRFDPNRHLDVEGGKQVVLSDNELRMLSFSTGRRGCPGVVLGSTITTMMLARMLQGFTWEVPHNESRIELVENHDDLSLANPLVLLAKPRLPYHIYPKI